MSHTGLRKTSNRLPEMPSIVSSMGRTWMRLPYLTSWHACTELPETLAFQGGVLEEQYRGRGSSARWNSHNVAEADADVVADDCGGWQR